jgi:hypothetical protein
MMRFRYYALKIRRKPKRIEPEKLALVAETNALRKHNGGYVIAPNAFYEELEALALPSGTYWQSGDQSFLKMVSTLIKRP